MSMPKYILLYNELIVKSHDKAKSSFLILIKKANSRFKIKNLPIIKKNCKMIFRFKYKYILIVITDLHSYPFHNYEIHLV